MLISVKFEFLGSLKDHQFFLAAETFEEDGCTYVSTIEGIGQGCFGEVEGDSFTAPPYLAAKDLPGFLQAAFPQARIELCQPGGNN